MPDFRLSMLLTFKDYRDLESCLRQTASFSFLFSRFTSFFGKVGYQNGQPNKSYSGFNCAKDIDIYRLPLTQFGVVTWFFVQNP